MSQHILTIRIVLEVPDEKSASAIAKATDGMLDDGTIQDWLLDAADVDDGCRSIEATCEMRPAKPDELVEEPEENEEEDDDE